MSRPVLYESPEEARLAASSALTIDPSSAASVHVDSAELPRQDPGAEDRARANVKHALDEIMREWGESSQSAA